ncbi:MAG TPA: sugar-binding protein [Pseudomonas sp.]|uniref:RHS repeat domain-containing protein n=1 Tax=Pseudomonas sp. TaxID=306 RepID=UPI002B493C78|nr:sugar-binding protein [Pseudomonas sp.]HKS11422.1 sugar-binding protein [Pseudomonas sp.]
MTTKSYIHSNAFNFLSFVAGSVDPRTGQYGLAIELPELPANQLSGPNLPLRIAFNPMNNQDSGFGVGWSLNLSQFIPSGGMLSLHTGENFKVADNGPGETAVIAERKIESFKFENVSEGQATRFRIAHKSGLIELLEPQAPDYTVALPVRVLAPTGHGIALGYTVVRGIPCLSSIVDDSKRTLLRIDYSSNARVLVDLNPDTAASARYTLERTGDQLMKVVLPTQDQACWVFTYQRIGELRCLASLQTPMGGTERIEYQEQGHGLPGGEGRTLPYVKRHVITPGAGMPEQDTRYTFSTNNFLGYGTGIRWGDDGLDNLYKFAGASYLYSSTESQYQDGIPVRTITRTFNRFHLATEQVETQDGCIQTVTTTYHEVANQAFRDQPANFQLPRVVTTTWTRTGGSARRDEAVSTEYDLHGNLTREEQPSGVTTEYTYYPKDASPADPEGFVRQLKSRTVTPASTGEGQAEALRTEMLYELLPSLVAGERGTLVPATETLVRVSDGAILTHASIEHAKDSRNVLEYGRRMRETNTHGVLATHTGYAYALVSVGGHPALETQVTVSGFDHGELQADGSTRHAQKINTLQHSVLIGEPLLNYDDNQVQIAYTYDELRRVTSETVSPNDEEYKATRSYSYHLSANGNQAVQTEVDVKGVMTWTYVDGLSRVVRQMRQDPDFGMTVKAQEAPRLTYTATYDALGNLAEEVEHDWLQGTDLPLRRAFEYDGWGQRYCEVGPDGVRTYEKTDPIGTPESDGPILRQWRASADGGLRTGETITWFNRFDKPARVERLACDEVRTRVSLHQYFHDGLGRTAREIDGRDAQVSFIYDEFDRLQDHTLADGSIVQRAYAAHSQDDLPVLIKVLDKGVEKVLGEQAFDGLDRMVTSITGGRKRTLSYAIGQRQPLQVITPSLQTIKYAYLPQLGEEPLQRALIDSGVEAGYQYDRQNARLLHCQEQGEALDREYFSTGQLRKEVRTQGGSVHTMHYVHSLRGRMLSYTDVLGNVQSYSYNAKGQLVQTSLDTVASTFEYDDLGRTRRIFTQTREHDGSIRSLATELEYDDFERETLRRFDFGDSLQALSQTYDAVDAVKVRTLSQAGRDLRKEEYTYDKRGRLVDYRCTAEDDYRPVDHFGKKIQSQRFDLDGLDNITRVRTGFEGGTIDARYQFENALDPAQLTGIVIRGLESEPRTVALEYDGDGNLTKDEQGRTLEYDALGRLVKVEDGARSAGAAYGYDPLDRLALQVTEVGAM